MSATDRQIADYVLQALTRARYTSKTAAHQEVGELRWRVGTGGDVERERAEAWLAICALHDALAQKQHVPDLDARWQKAIDKSAAWLETLK